MKEPTSRESWKKLERSIAAVFGTYRTPLSGMAKSLTKADMIHPVIFNESKYRNRKHTFDTVYSRIQQRRKERKSSLVVGLLKQGLWCLYSDDFLSLEHIRSKLPCKIPRLNYLPLKRYKSIVSLYEDTRSKAKVENKIAIVTIRVKARKGWLIVFDRSDLKEILNQVKWENQNMKTGK